MYKKELFERFLELSTPIKTLDDLNPDTVSEINRLCAAIRTKYPDTIKICLEGSYRKGTYVNEHSTNEKKYIRFVLFNRSQKSDFDFSIIPQVIDINFDGKNDIIAGSSKIVVWEK